jgi:hypothetical protein
VGACNPVAVRSAIATHTPALGSDHPAVRAMQGHLDFLEGTSIGPEFEDLDAVLSNARRLGIHREGS